jgi:hypothetical protein
MVVAVSLRLSKPLTAIPYCLHHCGAFPPSVELFPEDSRQLRSIHSPLYWPKLVCGGVQTFHVRDSWHPLVLRGCPCFQTLPLPLALHSGYVVGQEITSLMLCSPESTRYFSHDRGARLLCWACWGISCSFGSATAKHPLLWATYQSQSMSAVSHINHLC